MDGLRIAVAGAVGLAWTASASAQNALGDGRRLDRNLLRGAGRANTPVRDLQSEIRFRNAIVTGNAPGGMSLRANVGYEAPGEFMAPLGSNNLFSFRRDSVYSGLAGLGIRGTDALQYQFALTTGNAPPPGLMGPGFVAREGGSLAVPAGAAARSSDPPVTQIPQGQPGSDMRGTGLWILRSPAGFVSTRSLQPSLLAVVPGQQPGQQLGVTASPLRGLVSAPLPEENEAPEPPPGSARRMDLGASEIVSGITPGRPAAENPEEETARRTGYQDLLDRMAARGIELPAGQPGQTPGQGQPEQAPAPVPEWRRRLDELQQRLEDLGKPGADRRPSAAPGTQPPDREMIDLLRDPDGRISRLAPSGFDAYAVHMQRGQQALRDQQYFAAEERFTAALGVRRNDPMAAIGRVHAQLGASLYSSAAANLRAALVSHPELAGARYGAEAFPDPNQSGRVIERLTSLLGAGGGLGPDTGLLLAYVGFQTGDTRAVELGLAALQEKPGGPRVPAQLKELGRILRGVWANPEPPK